MTKEEILKLRDTAEQTRVQFKERVTRDYKYDISCEMVAQSNYHGGMIIVGINDKTGIINPLSFMEVQETTNLLGSLASEGVVPPILLDIENVAVDGGALIVAYVKEGRNKPYHDSKGIVWVKQGADRRKVFDNAELAEMMTQCGTFAPDEAAVNDFTLDDLDEQVLKKFILSRFKTEMKNNGVTESTLRDFTLEQMVGLVGNDMNLEKLLRNLKFIRPDGKMTVAAVLLFGKYPQRWLPTYTAKCICFVGNSIGGSVFRDKVMDSDMEGCLLHQYETIMNFYRRNLKNVQVGTEFNSLGELEIPYEALVEFTVNALVHRSLNWQAPIRIFILDDRVEIHSPGELPNGLTVEEILKGTSMPRNKFLFTNANYLLPYTGAGTGITRAMKEKPDVTFENMEEAHEFVIVIRRRSNQESVQESVQESAQESVQDNVQEKQHKIKLTKNQKDIVNFCSVPRSAKEIMERIGLINHSANKKRHIQPLLEMGALEMTNPDNPKDRNQKYRKVIK
ncbi:MAG: putative DNA binding domain-containing protein [Bacteroidaceae bacterium]|nr:putative DNA binding domain-containing protein [Bacteroidaceae bacterium]